MLSVSIAHLLQVPPAYEWPHNCLSHSVCDEQRQDVCGSYHAPVICLLRYEYWELKAVCCTAQRRFDGNALHLRGTGILAIHNEAHNMLCEVMANRVW